MSQSEGQKFLKHLATRGRWVDFPATAQAVADSAILQNPASTIEMAARKIFGVPSDDFATFDLALGNDAKPLGATPDAAAELAPQNLDAEDIAREVEKRRTVNALMQGGAVVATLSVIQHSDLPDDVKKNYADLVAAGTFQQQQLAQIPDLDFNALRPAGVVEVSQGDSGIAHIKARAVDGAVLAHEASKGLLELTALWSMPGAQDDEQTPPMIRDYNEALRREVMRRADRPEHELEDILRGIALWVDYFGKEIGPETLGQFQELCLTPAAKFNAVLAAQTKASPSVPTVVDPQHLATQLDDNLRTQHAIKRSLDDDILRHANLPDDAAAKTAIIGWMTGAQLRNYLASQPGGAVALTTPDMQNRLKHIIDYLNAALTDQELPDQYALTPAALQASTFEVLAAKAEKWMAWQSRQEFEGILEAGRDYAIVMELADGMQLVELKTPTALDYEGQHMGHCIGGSYDSRLNGRGGYRQYSLWDKNGAPHCTFEVYQGELQQCQGKKNAPPVARYVPYVMAAILQKGWRLGDIEPARTGLVADRLGKIHSVHDLPDMFDGHLKLNGVQTEIRLPRHVRGSVVATSATLIDLTRTEKIEGDLQVGARPMADVSTAHLRAIRISGDATWPLGVISDKRGKIHSAYDLCDEVFDGDLDLSGTKVTTLGQHCKKITGSIFNGEALLDTGVVEDVGGDIRGCHALQRTHVKKVGGNIAGLLSLTAANDLEDIGQSLLVCPLLKDAPRLKRVGKNFYLNSTAIERVLTETGLPQIFRASKSGAVVLPDDKAVSAAAANSWLENSANKLTARRAANGGRLEIRGDELQELLAIHHNGDILPDKTVLVKKMGNGDSLITTRQQLPNNVSWNELVENTSEDDIKVQRVNIHAQFVKQGADDRSYTDWFLPTMTGKDDKDECWALYEASGKGALRSSFDKSGSFPASAFWSARRYYYYYAYCQWVGDGNQFYGGRNLELPVRPVRRLPRSPQGAALIL